MEIQDGEFVFMVGPSGSGKSTVIKLLIGEIEPSEGKVMVNGFSLRNIREWQIPYMRRTVGVIFQDMKTNSPSCISIVSPLRAWVPLGYSFTTSVSRIIFIFS